MAARIPWHVNTFDQNDWPGAVPAHTAIKDDPPELGSSYPSLQLTIRVSKVSPFTLLVSLCDTVREGHDTAMHVRALDQED